MIHDDELRKEIELILNRKINNDYWFDVCSAIYEMSLYEGWWGCTCFRPRESDMMRIKREFERKKNVVK